MGQSRQSLEQRTRRATAPYPNSIPCASGSSVLQLTVFVWRRMYAFHESDPDSRPPPVSFSPPNAPPISAPEVPMLWVGDPAESLPQVREEVLGLADVVSEDRDEDPGTRCGARWPR